MRNIIVTLSLILLIGLSMFVSAKKGDSRMEQTSRLLSDGEAPKSLTISGDYLYVTSLSGNYGFGVVSKINRFTMTVEDRIVTNLYDILGAGPDGGASLVTGNYLIVVYSVNYSDYYLLKIDLTTFTTVTALLIEGVNIFYSSAYSWIRRDCMVVDAGYLYIAIQYAPGKILKINLDSFSIVSELIISGERAGSLAIAGPNLYVGCLYGKIVKVNLSTFTESSTLSLSNVKGIYAMIIDGNYLYTAHTGPIVNPIGDSAVIMKIDLPTFTENSQLDLEIVNEDYPRDFDIYGDSIYVACWNGLATAGTVVKINKNTFTRTDAIQLDDTNSEWGLEAIINDGTTMYCSCGPENGSMTVGRIARITLSTFIVDTTKTLEGYDAQPVGVITSGNYLYIRGLTSIIRVNKKTLVKDCTVSAKFGSPDSSGLTISGNYLYATDVGGIFPITPNIYKVDLSTFTLDTLTLTMAAINTQDIVASDTDLYASADLDMVVKIDLATFTETDHLHISWSHQIAISGNYLYVADILSPANIYKVDLSTFTLDDTLILNVPPSVSTTITTINSITSMIVHGGYLYVGSEDIPARFAKIDLSSFSIVAVAECSVPNHCSWNSGLIADGNFIYAAVKDYIVQFDASNLRIIQEYHPINGSGNEVVIAKSTRDSIITIDYDTPAVIIKTYLSQGSGPTTFAG